MNNRHCFDRYLKNANGNYNVQIRQLGNSLLYDAKAAAEEWKRVSNRFLPTDSDLTALFDGSWLLKVTFTLSRPFTSKTESEIHPHEKRKDDKREEWFKVQNPIIRDHVTGLPLVRPTTWKGHLRFAARMHGVDEKTMTRCFGTTRADESGQAGRLRFFPTFFADGIKREVVTPLKRDTRTPARGPIDIEVVPTGTAGSFCLLYVPHPKGKNWAPEQITQDLEAVGQALRAMFLKYGFSAKKTAGWGVVNDRLSESYLWAKGPAWPPPEKDARGDALPFESPDDAYVRLMDESGMAKHRLKKSNGEWLSNNEFKALAEQPCSLSVYKRFRRWHDIHGDAWHRKLTSEEPASALPVKMYMVESVTALCDLATRLAATMRKEPGNG